VDTIAVIGGTGGQGFGLAARWAGAGYAVIIGSRARERAEAAAQKARDAVGGGARVQGLENRAATEAANIVVLTVPFEAQVDILKGIKDALTPGKLFVDVTVPLAASVGGRATRTLGVWQGSAAAQATEMVPKGVPVVAAFQTVAADALQDLQHPLDSDVLVCGDDKDAKQRFRPLVEAVPGARFVDAGPLENSRILEQITALLIGINIRHKVHGAGIRITGLPS
jgi:NADPH-dependent F420 reductase